MSAIKPKRSPTPDLPGRYLATGLIGFIVFAAGVPLLAPELARTNDDPKVFALAHVAVLGWITMTMFGALYQLFPVALGGTVRSARLGRWNWWVLVIGLAGFVPSFYFGCEAEDHANAWAFNTTVTPGHSRLHAILGTDIGHFDVTDMSTVLAEAWELVEDGLIASVGPGAARTADRVVDASEIGKPL